MTNTKSSFLRSFLAGLTTLGLAVNVAFGQGTTGSITGTVQDTSGAIMAGITVTLVGEGTGSIQTNTSDADGNFRFLQLPPGIYSVEVSTAGFKRFRHEGLIMQADRSMAVPVVLSVGQVTETVEVSGSSPLLEPNTSSLGTTVETQKLRDLPLPANNPFGLLNLVPTVKLSGLFGAGTGVLTNFSNSAVTIGGGTTQHNGFMLDGLANNKFGDAAGPMITLPLDGVAEVRVITNAFAAEFGYSSGGIVSVVSKSGTNAYHGSLFEYIRNSATNSNDFFSNKAGSPKPPLVLNQFGGALGGALKKDKIFFYINAEVYKEVRSTGTVITSPSALERAGDFSQTFASSGTPITIYDPLTTTTNAAGASSRTAFPGNVIPSNRISFISKQVFALWPLGNLPGLANTRGNNLFQTTRNPVENDTWGAKVDYQISQNQRLAVRYTRQRVYWTLDDFFNNLLTVNARKFAYIPRQSGSLEYNHTLSPSLLMAVKMGISRDYDQGTAPATVYGGFDQTTWGFPAKLQAALPKYLRGEAGLTPRLAITDASSVGGGTPHGRAGETWANGISITKIAGAHTFKTGYEFRFYAFNPYDASTPSYNFTRAFTQGPNPNTASNTAGFGVASFLLGFPASGSFGFNPSNTKSRRYHGMFVQDDWKATRKLTLNLGMRWEFESAPTDRNNVFSVFDPTLKTPTTLPGVTLTGGLIFPGVNGNPRTIYDASYDHFGPRFGFAYQALAKLVVRGGYGISWEPLIGGFAQTTGFSSTTAMVTSLDGGLRPYDTISDPFPNGFLNPDGAKLGGLTGIGQSINGQLRDLTAGYAQQWNLTLQYEPVSNLLVETAYIANKGTHLQGTSRTMNQLPNQYLSLGNALNQQVPNPYYGLVSSGPLSTPTITRQQSLLPFPQFTAVSGGWHNLGASTYHAFTLKVERRMSRGFSVMGAYAFSKLIDAGTGGFADWYNQRADKATGANNIPHRLVINGTWEVPFAKSARGWQRQVAGGWQFNTITTMQMGQPIVLGTRPNVVPGCQVKLENPTVEKWFNTACYTQALPFTFGNASRTIPGIFGPGIFNVDLSLFKDFFVTEKVKLQFRAAAFNLTNTAQFQNPAATIGNATFGVVSQTGTSGSVYLPGSREFQFALRLSF